MRSETIDLCPTVDKRTERKAELLRVWLGDTCVCGSAKESCHWLCSDCWQLVKDTFEWKQVAHMCDAYFYDIEVLFEKVTTGKKVLKT